MIWNIFSPYANTRPTSNSNTNIGLAGNVSDGGWTLEGLTGLSLTSVILSYNLRNYSINKQALNINEQNLVINKRVLENSDYIRKATDEHLDRNVLIEILKQIKILNKKTDRTNELLEQLLKEK